MLLIAQGHVFTTKLEPFCEQHSSSFEPSILRNFAACCVDSPDELQRTPLPAAGTAPVAPVSLLVRQSMPPCLLGLAVMINPPEAK